MIEAEGKRRGGINGGERGRGKRGIKGEKLGDGKEDATVMT